MKKFVSLLLMLTMLVTVFAGLAVTASAADALLSVYTQAGEDGEKTLAKSYTAEELKKLAETKADGYGYQYFKKGEQDVVVTEFVTLDALLTDADVTFADGDSLSFVCDDGPYTKYAPTYKDITEGKYYFKDGKAEEVPAALALVWGVGAAADGTVADIAKTAKEAGLRFVCGTTEADFTAEKPAGKRMPSGVTELIVVSTAKAEEKPVEQVKAEPAPVKEEAPKGTPSAGIPEGRKIVIGGHYKHFKGGDYVVLNVAHDHETYEEQVVYMQIYDKPKVWVRPLKMFLEDVNDHGNIKPRFEFIDKME